MKLLSVQIKRIGNILSRNVGSWIISKKQQKTARKFTQWKKTRFSTINTLYNIIQGDVSMSKSSSLVVRYTQIKVFVVLTFAKFFVFFALTRMWQLRMVNESLKHYLIYCVFFHWIIEVSTLIAYYSLRNCCNLKSALPI